MNIQDIQTYIRLKEELDDLCRIIFYYVKYRYKEFLNFTDFSEYCKPIISKTGLCIEYNNDGIGYLSKAWLPDIPLECLDSETSWQKFLDDYYEKKKKEEEEKEAKRKQAKEDKERELYLKLKKKFEK